MPSNHFEDGHPTVADVAAKPPTVRRAVAEALVVLPAEAERWLEEGVPQGDASQVVALTLCDMLEGASEDVTIEAVRLLHEEGGRSGSWTPTPDR